MKSCLFVYNPNTGGNRLKNNLLGIVSTLAEAGYDTTVHPTRSATDAYDTAATLACGYDLLVCCGGDGTLNETVAGLQKCPGKQPLLGYIPGGTTNDFATSLGLPKNNMMKAIERIVHPNEIFNSDLGFFGEERVFTYVAAFGALTDVSYTTDQRVKDAIGYTAYVFEALGKLTNVPTITACIECDGEALEGTYILGMVTNSKSVGGFHLHHEDSISLNDGRFEVILIRQANSLAELSALSSAVMRRDFDSPHLEVRHAREIKVFATEPISWTLDGEFGGKMQNIDIHVKPNAFSICI